MSSIGTTNGSAQAAVEQRTKIETIGKWVRVEFNGQIIADSRSVLLVRNEHRLTYYFPLEDVNQQWLIPARTGADGRDYFDVVVDEKSAPAAAWSYPDSHGQLGELGGYVAFNWRKMDRWFEEEEEVFIHPRDPHVRLDLIQSSRHIKVVVDGLIVAESSRPVLLFETGLPTRYYLPQEDVRMDLLEPTRIKTSCPYKGDASYWSLTVGDKTYKNLVWGYLEPIQESGKIKGLLSFFNEKVDIYVDGVLEDRPVTSWS